MPPEPPIVSSWQGLRRLRGRSPSLRLSRTEVSARLWLDDGQLVQETVRSYAQEIQRFALADIQAIQIRRTARGLVYNIVLTALLALPLFGLVKNFGTSNWSFGDYLALSIICRVLALLLLINTLRGATCRTVLTTALGPQPLPSLSRMRTARRALDAIIVGTETVQGALRPEETALQVDRTQTGQR